MCAAAFVVMCCPRPFLHPRGRLCTSVCPAPHAVALPQCQPQGAQHCCWALQAAPNENSCCVLTEHRIAVHASMSAQKWWSTAATSPELGLACSSAYTCRCRAYWPRDWSSHPAATATGLASRLCHACLMRGLATRCCAWTSGGRGSSSSSSS